MVVDTIKFGSESDVKKDSNYGVNISPSVWHAMIALTLDSVLFEVQSGPFDPSRAKAFAQWALTEGSSLEAAYLKNLRESIGFI